MGCSAISKDEIERIKQEKKKDRFQHEWLFRKAIKCEETGIWWAVYIEGEGMYCLLCRKHQSKSTQNKSETFATEPSTRFKWNALTDHLNAVKHQTTVANELLNRVSHFQKQLDEKKSVSVQVLETVFHAVYWLAKECISNRKITSFLELFEILGLGNIKYFSHRSSGSLREMFITIGETVRDTICEKLREDSSSSQYYGLLVDDMADISNTEQMIAFVQYFDLDLGSVFCKYLFIADVLEESDSANAATLHAVITKCMDALQIPMDNMRGLATDGAGVMTGRVNGLAALFKRDLPTLVSVHCVCHRLALACTDTNENLKKIKDVEIVVTQLWKVFDNSPKKLAAYLKIQKQIKDLTLGTKANKRITRRLKKACKTRWLSFDNSIAAVHADIPTILQTLRQLKSDPSCYGLLKKLLKPKTVGTIYILHAVLPILSELSKIFQLGTINFARIAPCIELCKDKLMQLAESKLPISTFQNDLCEEGPLAITEIKCSSNDRTFLEKLLNDYVTSLIKNISIRFKSSIPVLTAMQVFDPTAIPNKESGDLQEHGREHINVLAGHYFPDDEANRTQLQAEWNVLKYDLLQWKLPQSVKEGKLSPAEWVLKQLCKQKYSYRGPFPLMIVIVESLLVIPVSNAWPERGASKVKLIKTRLRSLMKADMLNSLMHVSFNGPPTSSQACTSLIKKCVQVWLSTKHRKKLPIPVPKPSATSDEKISMQTQGTQTDILTQPQQDQQVSEEVEAAAAALGISRLQTMGESDYCSSGSESED
jgi:hypothetical protein